jgi:hypothetical protein
MAMVISSAGILGFMVFVLLFEEDFLC